MKKSGLGRGLDALLADNSADIQKNSISVIRLSEIEPNKKQARKSFDMASLEELAASISQHGILQPIVVRRKANGYYEIIAGERRWRASKMLGLNDIPAVIKDAGDETAAMLSLIENLQRDNLNPVEEAGGYRDLIEKFGLTQEDVAKKVGKSRTAVTNLLRILKLPQKTLALVSCGSISYGHARALLPLMDCYNEETVSSHAEKIAALGLSVRETEKYVKVLLEKDDSESKTQNPMIDLYYKQLENKSSETLGRRVSIKQKGNSGGLISIAYSGIDDLETLIKTFCGNNFFDETGDNNQ